MNSRGKRKNVCAGVRACDTRLIHKAREDDIWDSFLANLALQDVKQGARSDNEESAGVIRAHPTKRFQEITRSLFGNESGDRQHDWAGIGSDSKLASKLRAV